MSKNIVFLVICGWTWLLGQTATVEQMSYRWAVICRIISENGQPGLKELQDIRELKTEILQNCMAKTMREVSQPGLMLGIDTKVYEDLLSSTYSTDKCLYVLPAVDCSAKTISVQEMQNAFRELIGRVRRNRGVFGSDIDTLNSIKQQVLDACTAGILREVSQPKSNFNLEVKAYDYLEKTGSNMIVRDCVALPAVDCNVPTARKKQTLTSPQYGEQQIGNGAFGAGRSQDYTHNYEVGDLQNSQKYHPSYRGIGPLSSFQNIGAIGSERNRRAQPTYGITSGSRNDGKRVTFDTSANSEKKQKEIPSLDGGILTGDPFQAFINKQRNKWKDELIAEFGLEVED